MAPATCSAYNYTASPVTAEFTLAQPAASIIDYDTGVTSAPDTSTTFSGAFQPYQAHILLISNTASVADAHSKRDAVADRHWSPDAVANLNRYGDHDQDPNANCRLDCHGNSYRHRDCDWYARLRLVPQRRRDSYHDGDCDSYRNGDGLLDAHATSDARRIVNLAGNLKFGVQRLGTTSSARTLKVTNASRVTVDLPPCQLPVTFAQTNTCGASLAAHYTCSISVTFKPTATGKQNRQLAAPRQRHQ